LQEIKALKDRWRQDNESRRVEVIPRLTFNQWLQQTENSDRFQDLEAQRKHHADILSQGLRKSFPDAQEQARRAARPILAMDQSAWPDSDNVVQFTGLGPYEDNDDDDFELEGLDTLENEDIHDLATPPGITSSPPLVASDLGLDPVNENTTTPGPAVTINSQLSGKKL
jgi:hypothetical protein